MRKDLLKPLIAQISFATESWIVLQTQIVNYYNDYNI